VESCEKLNDIMNEIDDKMKEIKPNTSSTLALDRTVPD
jgi:cell division protein ZapA (FtsZ GTPase activity inhibitor)